MDPLHAAAKAFRACRLNHAKSRNVASYLTRLNLIGSGLTTSAANEQMPALNELLDEWFAARTNDPAFVPSMVAASEPATADPVEESHEPGVETDPIRDLEQRRLAELERQHNRHPKPRRKSQPQPD